MAAVLSSSLFHMHPDRCNFLTITAVSFFAVRQREGNPRHDQTDRRPKAPGGHRRHRKGQAAARGVRRRHLDVRGRRGKLQGPSQTVRSYSPGPNSEP